MTSNFVFLRSLVNFCGFFILAMTLFPCNVDAAATATTNSVTLYWTAPGDDGSTGTASQYDVRYSTTLITDANWSSAVQVQGVAAPQVAGSPESLTITGLDPSTTYYFAVKAADEALNWSAMSNVISVTTDPEAVPPSAIANLATGNITETSVTLIWTAPGDDGNTGTASQYDIRYSLQPINDANWSQASQVNNEPTPKAAGSTETYTLGGLLSGVTYYVVIKTADEVPNWSPLSNVASFTTLTESTAPTAVADLDATSSTDSSVTLTWTATGDDGTSGTASHYELRYSTVPITAQNWLNATLVSGMPSPQPAGSSETFTVNNLNDGTTYYFALKVGDEVPNWSGISNVATRATIDVTAPAAINDLQASTGPGNGEIDLGWTAPGNNDIYGIADFYEIRFSLHLINEQNWYSNELVSSPPQPAPPGSRETLTLTGLVPGQTYYVAMRAGDSALNVSAVSNIVSATSGINIATGLDEVDLVPAAPRSGSLVRSARPVLSVNNIRPEIADLYLFEVAFDSNFVAPVFTNLLPEEEGPVTSWRVPFPLEQDRVYYWRVKTEGASYSASSSFTVQAAAPFAYPNPFALNQDFETVFTDLPDGADVTLMSSNGDIVRSWSNITGGELAWNGYNDAGQQVASGVYLWYVPQSGDKGKLVVVR